MIKLPELGCLIALLEISSATNEVAMLNNGMLKIFDTILKIDTPIPAEANSNAPFITYAKGEQKLTDAFIQKVKVQYISPEDQAYNVHR